MGLGLGILGAARELLASRKAKGYAQEMGYHPNISSRYGEMVTDMDAARLMVYRAAWEYDTRGGALETFHWFMKAKLAVGNALQRVVNNAMVSCGAHALFRSQALERMVRDAATAAIMTPNSDACSATVGLLSLGLNPAEAPSLKIEDAAAPPANPVKA